MAEFNPSNKNHVVTLQGRNYITFVGLQARLADQGKSIVDVDVEVLRDPFAEENYAKRWATVKVSVTAQAGDLRGTIRCLGDASTDNVSKALGEATLRMAETRATARALRILTRSPFTAIEELPPEA